MFHRFVQIIYFVFQKFGIDDYVFKFLNRHPSNYYITVIFLWNKFSIIRDLIIIT